MDTQYTRPTRVRINPSRSTCEEIIRRILTAEIQENGSNSHFKNATDFMSYFESLYPASSALTKQVQRAIRSLDLAKDANGYFLLNMTKKQLKDDEELSKILEKTSAEVSHVGSVETVFLKADPAYRTYLLTLIEESASLSPLYITVADTSKGLLFFTEDIDGLTGELQRLLLRR